MPPSQCRKAPTAAPHLISTAMPILAAMADTNATSGTTKCARHVRRRWNGWRNTARKIVTEITAVLTAIATEQKIIDKTAAIIVMLHFSGICIEVQVPDFLIFTVLLSCFSLIILASWEPWRFSWKSCKPAVMPAEPAFKCQWTRFQVALKQASFAFGVWLTFL